MRTPLLPLAPLLGVLAAGCIDTQLSAAATKLAVNPELLDLGIVAAGGEATGTVSVSSVGVGSLTVVSLTVQGNDAEAFEVDRSGEGSKLPKGESIDVPITFRPTSLGAFEADLTVQSDANTGEDALVVHLRGIAAAPSLVVYPTAVDFGLVAPGADVFATVTLQALGFVPATLSAAEITSDGSFYLVDVSPPAEVAAGDTLELHVGFGPVDSSGQTGALKLATDDPDLPLVVVPLSANVCLGDGAEDADGDGVSACAGDCNDTDATVYPGANETADGADNDCDGTIDEGTENYDDDGDGWSEWLGDCNDGDASVSPDATETLDGVDEDCDGLVDDGTDGYDDDGDGFTENGGDCDDTDSSTSPGASEVPDGVDNDCDGVVDEDTSDGDDDGDGWNEAAGDCDDTDPTAWPGATEVENGRDDDCDGTVDEGTNAYDDDGDGYTENGGDCDDTDPDIGPHRLETIGDGVDNDCDGSAQ
jgi:hypothetical protein